MSDVKDRLKDQPPFIDEEGEPQAEPEEVEEVEEAEPKVEGAEDETPPETTEEEKKDRTGEQFEKLTVSNKKLNEENKKLKEEARKLAREGAVSTLIQEEPQPPQFDWSKMLTNTPPPQQLYPNMTNQEVKNVFNELVDDSGYVNTDLLKETLEKANKDSKMAKEEIEKLREEVKYSKRSMDDFQRSQIAKEVHQSYPELDPDSDGFNPDYFEAVRDRMVANMAKGQPEDFMGSAKSLYSRYTKMKKEDKKKTEEQQNAIAQINATGADASGKRRDFGNHDELVSAVRLGTKGALAERLKRSGY